MDIEQGISQSGNIVEQTIYQTIFRKQCGFFFFCVLVQHLMSYNKDYHWCIYIFCHNVIMLLLY